MVADEHAQAVARRGIGRKGLCRRHQQSREGLPCRIESSVFLGKYMNYTLDFGENMVLPDQPGIEYSQDIGHAERVFANGETIKLLPNEKKFNVYSEDGSRSLIKGVVQYA